MRLVGVMFEATVFECKVFATVSRAKLVSEFLVGLAVLLGDDTPLATASSGFEGVSDFLLDLTASGRGDMSFPTASSGFAGVLPGLATLPRKGTPVAAVSCTFAVGTNLLPGLAVLVLDNDPLATVSGSFAVVFDFSPGLREIDPFATDTCTVSDFSLSLAEDGFGFDIEAGSDAVSVTSTFGNCTFSS